MTNTNDLDDFFKKIDRKGNKHKKQPTLLTNNEELHKQLMIVTSATSAFKENMDFDEDDDVEVHRDESNGLTHPIEESQPVVTKAPPNSSSINNKSKPTTKLSVQDNNHDQQAGDEWEEFEDSHSKYDQLRLKFSRTNNGEGENNEDYDDDDDDGDNYNRNFDENINHMDEENTRRRDQQKDKTVWKLDQVKQQSSTNDLPTEKIEEPQVPVTKPATTGAYRPPQLRGNSSVTVVSGIHQRISKKEKPNLASTEEFPTLGATVNKK